MHPWWGRPHVHMGVDPMGMTPQVGRVLSRLVVWVVRGRRSTNLAGVNPWVMQAV